MTDNDMVELTSDVLKHVMALSEGRKNLILISLMRNSPTTASFSANFEVPKLFIEPVVNKEI